MRKSILIIAIQVFVALTFSVNIYANSISLNEKAWYIPDSAKLQFAGNTGFLSIGASYLLFDQHFEAALFYGYLPKPVGGVNIHTVAIKAYVHPYMFKIHKNLGFSVYVGAGLNKAIGEQYFMFDHDKRPDDYYGRPGLFLSPVTGIRFFYNRPKESVISSMDLFLEVGTTDRYIAHCIDHDSVKFKDIINISFGTSLYF